MNVLIDKRVGPLLSIPQALLNSLRPSPKWAHSRATCLKALPTPVCASETQTPELASLPRSPNLKGLETRLPEAAAGAPSHNGEDGIHSHRQGGLQPLLGLGDRRKMRPH